jgi:hypothetical protein
MVKVELYHEDSDGYNLFSTKELNADRQNLDNVRLLIVGLLGRDFSDCEYRISISRSHEEGIFDIVRVYFKHNLAIKRSLHLDNLLSDD